MNQESKIKQLENTIKQLKKSGKNTEEARSWKARYEMAVDSAQQEIDRQELEYEKLENKYEELETRYILLANTTQMKTDMLNSSARIISQYEGNILRYTTDGEKVHLANNHNPFKFDVLPF